MSIRNAQKHLTRQLLLSSGLAAMAEKGYDAVTIDDIAKRAGANRATFYLHFPSKAQLVLALIEQINDAIVGVDDPRLRELVASGDVAGLRRFLGRRFDQWPEVMPYITVANQAAYAEEAVQAAVDRWHESAVEEMVEGLTRAGRFDASTRRARARAAFAELEYFSRRWAREGWDADLTRSSALEVLTDSWGHLLVGPD